MRRQFSTGSRGVTIGEIARHDFAHLRFARAFPAQHHFAGVIALGDHPDQLAVVNDEERADVLFRHQRDRLVDGGVRRDRENLAAFLAENRVDCSGYVHDCEAHVSANPPRWKRN